MNVNERLRGEQLMAWGCLQDGLRYSLGSNDSRAGLEFLPTASQKSQNMEQFLPSGLPSHIVADGRSQHLRFDGGHPLCPIFHQFFCERREGVPVIEDEWGQTVALPADIQRFRE
jgi:hypothetical protein